jgi:hypothetical protein
MLNANVRITGSKETVKAILDDQYESTVVSRRPLPVGGYARLIPNENWYQGKLEELLRYLKDRPSLMGEDEVQEGVKALI